ncbi:MAG: large-conductance mechanosensitive channel protein MscL [Planctomycetota bacterium]|nr:MAG: large-conductance mechanosensitive channel protein MscL [Planctomycetota bacterium]
MGLLKEFRDFAMRGNVMDMAVGIIIGGAFGKIVSSLVNDVIMPPIGKLMGGVDFSNLKVVIQQAAPAVTNAAGEITSPATEEVAIRYGQFLNVTIDFLIVAFAIFMVIKVMNRAAEMMKKQEEAAPPPAPPKQEVLLEEIRDLLKAKQSG